jgi:hypothetical protein
METELRSLVIRSAVARALMLLSNTLPALWPVTTYSLCHPHVGLTRSYTYSELGLGPETWPTSLPHHQGSPLSLEPPASYRWLSAMICNARRFASASAKSSQT